ncbi:MAG: ribose-5-phosphate isomerase RpiA [Treponema sp.]|nr:ribose-5-phosphate isomerase RpiA [Treponema sp.]
MAISKDEQKLLAAKTAIDTLIKEGKIFSGMKIGLGTGSTALPAVKRLSERIEDGTLKDIKAVVTSFQTENYCKDLGIPVYTLNDRVIDGQLDLTIDGADEIDGENNLIKGGGAALLLEKIVAYNSKAYAIVADESKAVAHEGTKFPLPVEIIGGARLSVEKALNKMGAKCTLREGVRKCGPVITDNGNQILDCTWSSPVNPAEMEDKIAKIVGVVEVGFFTKLKPVAFIAHGDGSVEIR